MRSGIHARSQIQPTRTASSPRRLPRRALTLLEILIAMGIAAMIMAATATLVKTSQDAFVANTSQARILQSGRLFLTRVRRLFAESFANELFPGARVIAQASPSGVFPDCLVIWHPGGPPESPDSLPRLKELIFFYPNPRRPNEILEVTVPHLGNPAPAYEDDTAWQSVLASVKLDPLRKSITWCDQLRSVAIDGSRRGMLRFAIRMRPTSQEWLDTAASWESLAWPQGMFSPQTGIRYVRLGIELQIQTDEKDTSANGAVPLLASASRKYVLRAERR